MHEIIRASDRKSSEDEINRFSQEFKACYSKPVETLLKDRDPLLAFFDLPAQHWIHVRSSKGIESTFSTVKARPRRTRGVGSRIAGLALAFKLLIAAEQLWRKINAPHLVALVRAGEKHSDGEQEKFQDKSWAGVDAISDDQVESTSLAYVAAS